ncbi:MAG: hypothetical protein GX432_10530 [Candidatus Atribacteria bacterium]|jgi:uncharacterized membrane protein YkoI|nr:hypothetical protein [Candidatus Atribacteria bacterium]
MDKQVKILIGVVIVLVVVIIGLVGMYYGGIPGFSSTQAMKNETFDGITVSVPVAANFTKSAYGNYNDEKLGLQITPVDSVIGISAFIGTIDNRKDVKRITLEGVPSDAICWKTEEGYTQILVVNSNATQGICVGAKDEKLAIQMANSVIFPQNQNTITSTGNTSDSNASGQDSIITSSQAMSIANSYIEEPGATAGTPRLVDSGGQEIYIVPVILNGSTVGQIEIDARTGQRI